MPLPTTSILFVATNLAIVITVDRLSRIVEEEVGLATTQLGTVGVTRSSPGRRCYLFPSLSRRHADNSLRLTRSIPTPTLPNPNAISCLGANKPYGPNNPPQTISIRSSGPVLLLRLKCFGVDLEGMVKLPCRGYTIMRTGWFGGASTRFPCNRSGAR